jgi:hypothetical protein
MSTAVAIPNTTTPVQREAADSVLGILRKYSKNIKGVLPAHLSGDRCAFLVMNSIAQNPKLADCTPVSFLNSVMLAANLGLEIRKNSCYLIPYGRECQLIVDYHGKMELARRAGVGAIHAELVREGDLFASMEPQLLGCGKGHPAIIFYFQRPVGRESSGSSHPRGNWPDSKQPNADLSQMQGVAPRERPPRF